MNFLVIAGSLRPGSHSTIMARQLREDLSALGAKVDWLHLAEHPLPLCDGDAAYDHPGLAAVEAKIEAAQGIVICVPIYNYDINAAVKNLIELTGSTWENKIVAFACAAGGSHSYMSVMNLANDLMLDFRCLIVPRFVYATKQAFENGQLSDQPTRHRLMDLARTLKDITDALPFYHSSAK